MPIFDTSLESANWWYIFSWRGILIAGTLTALTAVATVAFLFIQFWASNLRESFAGPRHLSANQQQILSRKLGPLAKPTQFIRQHASVGNLPETKEASDFVDDIVSVLTAAGWTANKGISGMMGESPITAGVVIRTSSNPTSIVAGNALAAALNTEHVVAIVLPERARGCEEEGRTQEYMDHEPACSMIQVLVREHP